MSIPYIRSSPLSYPELLSDYESNALYRNPSNKVEEAFKLFNLIEADLIVPSCQKKVCRNSDLAFILISRMLSTTDEALLKDLVSQLQEMLKRDPNFKINFFQFRVRHSASIITELQLEINKKTKYLPQYVPLCISLEVSTSEAEPNKFAIRALVNSTPIELSYFNLALHCKLTKKTAACNKNGFNDTLRLYAEIPNVSEVDEQGIPGQAYAKAYNQRLRFFKLKAQENA